MKIVMLTFMRIVMLTFYENSNVKIYENSNVNIHENSNMPYPFLFVYLAINTMSTFPNDKILIRLREQADIYREHLRYLWICVELYL